MELDLLQKTELWITGIELHGANLNEIAAVTARVLGLPAEAVMVVDVRDRVVVLDIMRRTVMAEQIVGREKELLSALNRVPGVRATSGTAIHAQGILGLIAADPEQREELLERSTLLAQQVRASVARRGVVFASGREVQEGLIEDTNSPYLISLFEQHGYRMRFGGILPDDLDLITGRLRSAVADGYGLVITTGGVGAEDKDWMVESISRLDPTAATPWILYFHAGKGRHLKDGVRIAVGQVELTTLVALPGPHDEVRLAAPVLLEALEAGWGKEVLADALARVLREKWRRAMVHEHHSGR
ncbi:molybdopterin-binding protein [Desulfofundulus thermosubterraneus]|uniref:Molybdenum cofactor synthesis domain-containing protein n=1 Tax=Desulfofundulus thermosubterraneus DSM 16057 TaxID=1121432 RepID=A0A1M6F8J8_9FIRM|nr:molybdopterin-binding protein [Desulfofundulus thermosubterraneus]SHI93992.1 molybdenum cofactor synthesis domain-containing protein [Desulfofundulus thermosubterraneus DSM 16057]